MTWHMGVLPPRRSTELAAVAHGPAILARTTGIVVGLRSIFAYSAGLEIALLVSATGSAAELVARQYSASAEIDPITGSRHPANDLGVGLRFDALDDSTAQPFQRKSTEGFGRDPERYEREFLFYTKELANSSRVQYRIAWPEVGLPTTDVILTLPDVQVLRDNIIILP